MTASIPGFQRVGHDVAIGGQPSSDHLAQLKQEGFSFDCQSPSDF